MRAFWSLLTVFSLLGNVAQAEKLDQPADNGSDAAAARELFIEARKLAAQGNYVAACPKFEEGQRLQPGIGALLNLADCWEHLGRTASAWARYLDVAALAARAGQEDREQIARQRATALEPRLARLTLHVVPEAELRVTRDAVEVREALWESATPVDPGEHVIEAHAPGKTAWRKVVAVGPSEHAELDVPKLSTATPIASSVSALSPAAQPAAAQLATSATRSPSTAVPSRRASASASPSLERTLGYMFGGVGILAVSVGVWSTLSYRSANAEALSLCANNACQSPAELERHTSLVNSATRERNLAFTAFAVGAGALTAGTWLLLTARASDAHRLALRVHPGAVTLQSSW